MAKASRARQGERSGVEPPAPVRRAVLLALGLAILGGLFLALQRGDAIMIDLAGLGRFFCL